MPAPLPPARRVFLARWMAGWTAACLATARAATPTITARLAAPRGKVVLTLSGHIERSNAPGRADFDLDMLAALPQRQLVTHTPWHEGPQAFTGPLLRDVLAEGGARGRSLVAVALDDYRCEIPFEDAQRFDVIVARLQNGQPMRVRDKGPLFIVYPFDSDVQLRSDRYYLRCAWQLRSLLVRP